VRLLWTIVATLIIASASEAQTDSLIGTWEGGLNNWGLYENSNRTLVIYTNVGNTFYGRYGITGTVLDEVTIIVDRSGPRPSISFVSGADSEIRLILMNEKLPVGNLHQPKKYAGFGLQDWKISLGKVR
jgi:hypothetical protein